MIATYLAGAVGELSEYVQLASIATVVIAFMSIKRRVDHLVEGYFTTKRGVVEFWERLMSERLLPYGRV